MHLTKNQALTIFKSDIIPSLRYKDRVAIRTAWNDYTDGLAKGGNPRAYKWVSPFK